MKSQSLADSIGSATSLIADGNKPQIIISDLRLRENTTGIEAIQKIRKQISKDIPALLVSGDTDPEKLKETQSEDLILLHKPLKPAQLRTAMNRLMRYNQE